MIVNMKSKRDAFDSLILIPYVERNIHTFCQHSLVYEMRLYVYASTAEITTLENYFCGMAELVYLHSDNILSQREKERILISDVVWCAGTVQISQVMASHLEVGLKFITLLVHVNCLWNCPIQAKRARARLIMGRGHTHTLHLLPMQMLYCLQRGFWW